MKINSTIDPLLQEEIASCIFNDSFLAEAVYRLVFKSDFFKKSNIVVFANQHINLTVQNFFIAYEKNGLKPPTDGVVVNLIVNSTTMTPEEREHLKNSYLKIKNKKVSFSEAHESFLKDIIADAYTTSFVNQLILMYRSPKSTFLKEVRDMAKGFSKKIEDISFAESDVVNFDSIREIIEEMGRDAFRNIPTGLAELDRELNGGGEYGGCASQEITVWLAPTNAGKTFILGAVGSHAIRMGKKVRYFALEGRKYLVPSRMIANLTGISTNKIAKYREYLARNPDVEGSFENYFSKEDLKKIEEADKMCRGNLSVIHAIQNSNIEYLEKRIEEEYAKDPFHVLLIDYSQLIETLDPSLKKESDISQRVFRRLEVISAKLKLVTHVASQVNRDGMTWLNEQEKQGDPFPVIQAFHVAGGISALKTAGCIISISCTTSERKSGKLRFAIIKQREGIVGVEVGIYCDFAHGRPFEGKRFRDYHPLKDLSNIGNDKEFKVRGTKKESDNRPTDSKPYDPKEALGKDLREDFVLKQFVGRPWTEKLAEVRSSLFKVFSAKQSLPKLEQQLKKIQSGLESSEDNDLEKLQMEVTTRKNEIANETDDILMLRDSLDYYVKFKDHFVIKLKKLDIDQRMNVLTEIAKEDPEIDLFIKHLEMFSLLDQTDLFSKL